MEQSRSKRNSPASLFLAIDEWDYVFDASIMDTSDENTRKYITWQMDKVKGYDVIPDYEIVEYRFPDRKAISPLKQGLENEYYIRDLYYALDGKNISGLYISLRMAAFL